MQKLGRVFLTIEYYIVRGRVRVAYINDTLKTMNARAKIAQIISK